MVDGMINRLTMLDENAIYNCIL